MISLNNTKFAKNDKEFVDSLFKHGGTCDGFYKKLKTKIKLFDLQKNLVGVINCYGIFVKATKLENGDYWYSYGNLDIIGDYDRQHERGDIEKLIVSRRSERCYYS